MAIVKVDLRLMEDNRADDDDEAAALVRGTTMQHPDADDSFFDDDDGCGCDMNVDDAIDIDDNDEDDVRCSSCRWRGKRIIAIREAMVDL